MNAHHLSSMLFENASLETSSSIAVPRKQKIHLIGVAGSGMSGIAGLLLSLGHEVSGSDKVDSIEVNRLQKEGLIFYPFHTAEHAADADLIIYSSAIKPGNPTLDEAKRLGKKMLRRAEALAALLNIRRGIVIAGMHGKTTTSSMTAHLLRATHFKPSHYVGAEIPTLGTNSHWDPAGEYFVAEGDESDGTLVFYHPHHSIILNIEEEHLDFYPNLDAIKAVYKQLIDQTRETVFYCLDDAHAAQLCKTAEQENHSPKRFVSYGFDPNADYVCRNFAIHNYQSQFEVYHKDKLLGSVTLNIPGRHNVSNALAAIALVNELGGSFEEIQKALEEFRGAKRRFEFKHQSEFCKVLDDYGHHPSEIRATLETARQGHPGRIVTLFQPHRYTRTQLLKSQFGTAFHSSDIVLVGPIYPASEAPIPGVTGQLIVDAMVHAGFPGKAHYLPDFEALKQTAARLLRPGDLLITLGAGNIHEISTALTEQDIVHWEKLTQIPGLSGKVKLYEPLSKHTTLKLGGPAQFWVEPETENAFAATVEYAAAHNLPLFVIGRGSNLLVRDGGIDGIVIHPVNGELANLEVNPEQAQITAGVGVSFKRLAAAATKAEIGGFEWMEGIPGSVGGGLRMNAGAMGHQTFEQVVTIRLLNAEGKIEEKTPDQLEIFYRNVPTLKTHYALSATFQGYPSSAAAIRQKLDASILKRKSSQPIAASAGCIFKNPSKDCPAGKLVEELNLKNTSVGQARVSEIHGNFLVNDGGASAKDALALIAEIQKTALTKRQIELETEVQIIGKG